MHFVSLPSISVVQTNLFPVLVKAEADVFQNKFSYLDRPLRLQVIRKVSQIQSVKGVPPFSDVLLMSK